MLSLALIGLVGGLVAGISPCILPVLPVIFMSGSPGQDHAHAVDDARRNLTPYAVVGGLVLSFSLFTLLGALVLSALPVPADTIRWIGIGALVLLGLGMIVPRLERVLERPFARFRLGNGGQGKGGRSKQGFALGLALGAVYVPCAGPVLAAITVAGATGRIGRDTVVLTISFALGTAVPLLAFALAGRSIGARVQAFRSRQRLVRTIGGVVVIALAVALALNLTDAIQRAVPGYTSAVDAKVERGLVARRAADEGGAAASLATCAASTSESLSDCGPAPAITGIQQWFNTPGDRPLAASAYAGKVVLVDFWAYSCINCQRAIPHVEAWYDRYRKAGLEVIGVHTPEYAFERVPKNVAAGTRRLKITYPVALDPGYKTWNAFANQSWPAEYLIDATGQVRHVAIGEGSYGGTERLIRALLTKAHPGVTLPAPTDLPDTTPTEQVTPETYLGAQRATGWVGPDRLTTGRRTFVFPARIGASRFALSGSWNVGDESLTAGPGARIALSFTASKVYLDVGGAGTVTSNGNGAARTIRIEGAPDIHAVVDELQSVSGVVVLEVSPGLEVYSFTFG